MKSDTTTRRERIDGLALDIDIASQRLVDQAQVIRVIKEALDAEWNAALIEARKLSMGTNDIGKLPTEIRKLMRGDYP